MSETVKLNFKYTEQEYVAAVRAYMLHTPDVIFRLGMFLTLVTAGVFMLFINSDAGLLLSLLWGVAVFAGIAGGLFYGVPKRRFRGDPKFRDQYFLEFSEEGIHLQTANVDSKLNWSLYTRVVEQEKFYLLVYGTYMMTVVPKRTFNGAQQEAAFRELLRNKLATRLKAQRVAGTTANELEGGYVPPPEPPDWR
jgi:hypothetical protein